MYTIKSNIYELRFRHFTYQSDDLASASKETITSLRSQGILLSIVAPINTVTSLEEQLRKLSPTEFRLSFLISYAKDLITKGNRIKLFLAAKDFSAVCAQF